MCVLKSNFFFLAKENEFVRLNACNKKHFDLFVKKLKINKQIERIYRGISFNNIFDKLSISKNSPTKYEELSNKLFMIGEKSKYYIYDKTKINPNDINDYIFEQIFDMLGSKGWDNTGFFIERNEKFFEFFYNKKNKPIFVKAIRSKRAEEQRYYRNRYLTLLHQLNCSEYKEYSFYTSTTKNFNIAKEFINEEGIILFSWKQKNSIFINEYNDENIPICNDIPFENEQEETEYRGLFPHYIYGFLIIDNGKYDKFIVNHHLFSLFNRKIEYVIKFGIFIDQSNFDKMLEETNYKNFFEG